MRKRRLGSIVALVPVLALIAATTAIAAGTATDGVIDSAKDVHGHNHAQHGGDDGHLPASSENVRVVGQAAISKTAGGRVSDVTVHGSYAYLGAFWEPDCQQGGVYVFDISNLSAPRQVGFINAAPDTYVGEGVQVVSLDTRAYSGDVLVHNNEICTNAGGVSAGGAKGGISLVDVTNPRVPRTLAAGVGDFDPVGFNGSRIAHEVHSAFAWQAGDKGYVVLVDNEEGPDVDIMDITDPAKPRLIAEYDLNRDFPQIIDSVKGKAESFHHDVVVKEIKGRQTMLVSYWDGGYVVLDVTNPANATYIGDTDFAAVDPQLLEARGIEREPEGNAHQAEFSLNNDYIVAADEDFDPYPVVATNVTDGTRFPANQGSGTPKIAPGQVIEGQTKYVGRACNTDPTPPAANGATIAVVERGVCTFTEKITNVQDKGYAAAVVFNRQGSDGCEATLGMLVDGTIPTIGVVARSVGFALFDTAYDEAACLSGSTSATAPIALGALGDVVRLESYFDGWGYVHLFRNGKNKLSELDTYAIPQAHAEGFAEGFGDLSVHEVAMSAKRNELAYFSYYAGGFRVARIERNKLVERGHYIAPGGNNFWGVQVFERNGKEYVAASDRDYGLYIFEYTGTGTPN